MNIKVFSCGFCKNKGKETNFSRKGLRKHLKEHVRNHLFNEEKLDKDSKTHKQSWVLEREI